MRMGAFARNAPKTKKCNRKESNRNGSPREQDGKETDNNDDLMQVQEATIQVNPAVV